jgi:hypothetical protein
MLSNLDPFHLPPTGHTAGVDLAMQPVISLGSPQGGNGLPCLFVYSRADQTGTTAKAAAITTMVQLLCSSGAEVTTRDHTAPDSWTCVRYCRVFCVPRPTIPCGNLGQGIGYPHDLHGSSQSRHSNCGGSGSNWAKAAFQFVIP